ncbi:MAG: thioredoxin family protein [Flavobacteriales bacterium]
MKKILFTLSLLLVVVGFSAFIMNKPPAESLEIGKVAPLGGMEMKGIDGSMNSLKTLNGERGLLVVFSCNTCPFVVGREGKSEGWENRYNDLHKQAEKMGFGMVLINSNEAKREGDDSMSEMQSHAKSAKYTMPYVVDKNHQLADAFGAKTTPHVYLFDADLKLAYKGAIDDNVDSADKVSKTYVQDAMAMLMKGQNPDPNSTKPLGCSIKRK